MNVNHREMTNYAAPTLGRNGSWISLGGAAVQASLAEGAAREAMELLALMSERTAKCALMENGFDVPLGQVGLSTLLANVDGAVRDAANAWEVGVGLAQEAGPANRNTFAAKALTGDSNPSIDTRDAKSVIEALMRAPSVAIELAGEAPAQARASLLMIAGQALTKGVQGFGFDGLKGKFEVPLNIAQISRLHRESASAVAEQSARVALGNWSEGTKVTDLHAWVPDSVQRLLHGAISMPAASAIVHAIESGAIARHAGEIGGHEFASLLSAQGVDVHARTVEQQATDLDLSLVDPERNRGQYVGKVVGRDHRAALIKFNRHSAIELPFAALPPGHVAPAMGDTVRVGFKAGLMSVSVAERGGSRDLSDR